MKKKTNKTHSPTQKRRTMNALSNSRELAINQIQQLYSTEKHCLMYLKVLAHKLTNLKWKEVLLASLPLTRQKMQQLRQLRAMMQVSSETANTAGINGIISEGFGQTDKEENPDLKDAIIIHTLILLAYYKLGNYRILLHYFQFLGREYEAFIVQSVLSQEEETVSTLMRLLGASIPGSAATSETLLDEITQPDSIKLI